MPPYSQPIAEFYGYETTPVVLPSTRAARPHPYARNIAGVRPNLVVESTERTHPHTFDLPTIDYNDVNYVSVADPHRVKPKPRTDGEKWMDTLGIPAPSHSEAHVLQGNYLSPNPKSVEILADGHLQRLVPDPSGFVYSIHGGHLGKRRLKHFRYQFEGGALIPTTADNYVAIAGRVPRPDVNVANLVRTTDNAHVPDVSLSEVFVPTAPPVIHFSEM